MRPGGLAASGCRAARGLAVRLLAQKAYCGTSEQNSFSVGIFAQPTNREPRCARRSDDTDASSEPPLTLLRPDGPSDAARCSHRNGCHPRPVNGCVFLYEVIVYKYNLFACAAVLRSRAGGLVASDHGRAGSGPDRRVELPESSAILWQVDEEQRHDGKAIMGFAGRRG